MEIIGVASLAKLLAIGAFCGLLILLWIFFIKSNNYQGQQTEQQTKQARYRRLIYLTTFLTFDLILFGSFTRLSDSGLGCPDWPGCYAYATPFHASAHIEAAEALAPGGPVTMAKAWVEMLHRYFAMTVGLLITVIMVGAWRKSQRIGVNRGQAQSPWLATALFFLVCLQGAFGAWTVTLKLQPIIVTTHLLLADILLLGLFWLGTWQRPLTLIAHPTWLRQISRFAVLAVFIQIALGGWVSSNYAVLACADFPLCRGEWLPPMDFAQAFTLWRPLGLNANGDTLASAALVAIHWLHRSIALVLVLLLVPIIYKGYKLSALRRPALLLAFILLLQIASGISNIVLQWPLLGALAHSGGAAALLLLLVQINSLLRKPGLNLTQGLSAEQRQRPESDPLFIDPRARASQTYKASITSPLNKASMDTPHTNSTDAPASASLLSTPSLPRVDKTRRGLTEWRHYARQYWVLTKPRVTQLAVFCAVIGMFLASPGAVAWSVLLGGAIGIGLLASAAFAINCLAEQKIDAKMKRTAWRPSARGDLSVRQILLFSLVLGSLGMSLLYYFTNPLTMWLTVATFVGYAVVYTLWLKPATPQNIVIGGLSGAMPPALGWAAVADSLPPQAWILVLIIFTWTPPHFWALALYRRHDYAQSGLPMLPVTHGERFTLLNILLYSLIMIAATLLPFIYRMSGLIYLSAAILLGLGFLSYAWRLYRHYSDALSQRTFQFSIIYLALLFAALLVDHYFLYLP